MRVWEQNGQHVILADLERAASRHGLGFFSARRADVPRDVECVLGVRRADRCSRHGFVLKRRLLAGALGGDSGSKHFGVKVVTVSVTVSGHNCQRSQSDKLTD